MHEIVKEYYGQTLSNSEDLKTDACCTDESMPDYIKPILSMVHDDVLTRYYGCGLVVPEAIEGLRILDLGCGAGRDVYALAGLVGETGAVVGVDMTPEQLAVAREHQQYHADVFGYSQPNTEFHLGYIERLDELGLADNSFDLIVSNCVLNLCPDKSAVLREAYRLLKPGGEMYFSDVYADRRIPPDLQADPVLYGECLSGALYWNDFLTLAKGAGFIDPRLVKDRPLGIENKDVEEKVAGFAFYSATWRLFKLSELEPASEDYGQAVTYKGSMAQHPSDFELDKHHHFVAGQTTPVSGNTWRLLSGTRFEPHFEFDGSYDQHRGIFVEGSVAVPFDVASKPVSGGCC
ncbi:MAG: methyltransferase domain-containing protein [Pseudomonadales bacterium]